METETRVSRASFLAFAKRIVLDHVHFAATDASDDEIKAFIDDWEVLVGLRLVRHSPIHLDVTLSVAVPEGAPLMLEVSYVVEYEMNPNVPEEERDAEWLAIAYQIAPGLLYPYLREMVSNITSRWRGGPLALPLIPLPIAYPEDEVAVPPAPADVPDQESLQLATGSESANA